MLRPLFPGRLLFFFVIVGMASFPTALKAQKRTIHNAEQPLAPGDAAASMQVPEGFRVTVFAGEPEVKQPIGFCIDDRGRLWVAEAYNYPSRSGESKDRIVILEDRDGDGRHDERTVFYEGLNYVSGIEVGFGGVWVMSPPSFYFIPDMNEDDVPDSEPTVLLNGFGDHANAHNMANGFAWGPDGWLYGTHGRTNWSTIGKPGDPDSARQRFDGGVYRYHPTQHAWEPYADGTTNPWGIDWNDVGDAFICNCVNPHLFHVIQGAHYEPWRGRESSQFAFQRIDTIADHLHFVGLGNPRNGIGSDAEDGAGGGHAHCGTMIYLGDQFPARYRNQLFTNNIHGRRINNDLLRRSGSGYTASHGPDLMKSADPWFMGVTLAQGPSGEVYVSDWSDTGECHSTKNTRKETGRLYRLTYLTSKLDRVDLRLKSNLELVELQGSNNEWLVRHARRLLQERASSSDDFANTHARLKALLEHETNVAKRLRLIWALHVTGGASHEFLRSLLSDSDENVRAWAIRLLCERDANSVSESLLIALAKTEPSARVRLELAIAAQRVSTEARWELVETLSKQSQDANDQNLPLMIWYAAEPLIDDNINRFTNLAFEASLSQIRENVSRRIALSRHSNDGMDLLFAHIAKVDPNPSIEHDITTGLLLGLEGQRRVTMPKTWPNAYAVLSRSSDTDVQQIAIQLALMFNDQGAIQSLVQIATTPSENLDFRKTAIRAVSSRQVAGFDERLIELLGEKSVRLESLASLVHFEHPRTANAILGHYAELDATEKTVAIETLTSRVTWAIDLLDAVESKNVPVSDINAFAARQLRSLGDKNIKFRLGQLWGNIRETPKARVKQIANMRAILTNENLRQADLGLGKRLFEKHCGGCHSFFGTGGSVGPDLTGAQRKNMDYLLENVVDPSASVAKEFRMHLVRTTEGRVITGMIESDNERSTTIINATGRVVIPKDQIEERKESSESVMPIGILDSMSETEIRDLFAYLRR